MTAVTERPAPSPAGPPGAPAWKRFATPKKGLLLLAVVVFLFAPRFTDNTVLIAALGLAFVFMMFGASWDIVSGYTGQVNFGHAAFIGTGAYTVALLSKYQPDVPGELALVLGTAVAALLGLIIGVPALRLKGPYLALATLSVAAALVQTTFILKTQTGAEDGISPVKGVQDSTVLGGLGEKMSEAIIGPLTFADANGLTQAIYVEYFVALVFMVIMVGGLLALGYGRRGLVLRSIQQDENASEAAGVPVTRYKLGAFVLSAACAGLAGGLLAQIRGSVALDLLGVDLSLLIIIVAAFGGIGSIIGPVVGALIVILLQNYYLRQIEFFRENPELELGAFALILIFVLVFQPRGLVPPLLQKFNERSAARAAGRAASQKSGEPQKTAVRETAPAAAPESTEDDR